MNGPYDFASNQKQYLRTDLSLSSSELAQKRVPSSLFFRPMKHTKMRRSSRMKKKVNVGRSGADAASAIDLSLVRHGYNYFEASKHRTCWVHILALKLAKGRRWMNEDNVDLERFQRTSPCFWETISGRGRLTRRGKRKVDTTTCPKAKVDTATCPKAKEDTATCPKAKGDTTTCPKAKVDTTTFDNYFRILWNKFPEDKKASFAYLDCLWFRMYYDIASRKKVLSWIKKEAIFSKKYVIVPIVLWDHWNLLILCNFDENMESNTRKPCMLLLDSLENSGPRRYESVIRKFMVDVSQALGRFEMKAILPKIPYLMPKVPQQMNDVECGNYVLYFIHLFINAAPEAFDFSNGCPKFMNKNWFDRASYETFCDQLRIPL